MKHPNATEALKLAGSTCKTQHAFEAAASTMLKNVEVVKYRDKLQAANTERAVKTKADLIQRMEDICWGDLSELVNIDKNGSMSFKPLSELTKKQKSLLMTLTQKDTMFGTHRTIKLPDPLKAGEILGRLQNFFSDDNSAGAETFAQALHKALSGGGDGT